MGVPGPVLVNIVILFRAEHAAPLLSLNAEPPIIPSAEPISPIGWRAQGLFEAHCRESFKVNNLVHL
jgi:hypothetical protein